jgi:branched-chain amino acid transport system substrate-binding protein
MFKKFVALFAVLFVLAACDIGRGYMNRAGKYIGVGAIPPIAQEKSEDLEKSRINNVTAPKNGQPVKVAIMLPLSGPNMKLGQAMLNAAQLALFNIAHDQFSLVPYDTGGTQDGARRAAQNAVHDNVRLVLGPLFATAVRGAKPTIMEHDLSMIAFTTDWSLAGSNTYLMGFLPFDQVNRIVGYAADNGVQRIGVLTPDSDYGRIVSSILRESAARYGVRVTAEEILPKDGLRYGETIRAFVRQDTSDHGFPYDAVLLPVGGEGAITASNLLTRYGASPDVVKRLSTGVMDDPRLFGEAGLKGTWIAAPEPSLRTRFEQDYKNIYGHIPPRLSTLAYDATALAAVLSQRSPDGVIARADIMNPNGFSGIDGVFRFRGNGIAERGLSVLEINNGRLATVDAAPRSFRN